METDKQLIVDLSVIHCAGEGDWLIADAEDHIGEDVD